MVKDKQRGHLLPVSYAALLWFIWVGNSELCLKDRENVVLLSLGEMCSWTDWLPLYAMCSIWRSNFQKKSLTQTVHQFEQLQMTCLIRLDFTMFNLAVPLRFWKGIFNRVTHFSEGMNFARRYLYAYWMCCLLCYLGHNAFWKWRLNYEFWVDMLKVQTDQWESVGSQNDCSCGIIRNTKLSKLSFALSSTEKEKESFQNHVRGTRNVLQVWIH